MPCLPRRRGLTGKISLHYDADIQRGLLSTPDALLGGESWKIIDWEAAGNET